MLGVCGGGECLRSGEGVGVVGAEVGSREEGGGEDGEDGDEGLGGEEREGKDEAHGLRVGGWTCSFSSRLEIKNGRTMKDFSYFSFPLPL